MARLIRNHAALIVATSAGIALGATATLLLHRFTHQIRRELALLSAKLDSLKRDVAELRTLLQGTNMPPALTRTDRRSYQSIHASSEDDDDDDFEEAIDGTNQSLGSTTDEYYSLSSNGGPVTPLAQLLPQVDRLMEGDTDELEQAYSILSNCRQGYSHDVEFMWRYAKSTYKVAQTKSEEEKQNLCYAAHDLASQALEMSETHPNVHKWYAITLGALSDYEPLKTKILNGYQFREHINKAMELSPDDATNYHLCGRWCYSVYMLSWVERNAAAALIASPPSSTAEEALEYFMKAEDLNEEWKENKLFIAKCLIEKREYYAVVDWLDKANQVPCVSPDDYTAQMEIDSLLYSYSGYRKS